MSLQDLESQEGVEIGPQPVKKNEKAFLARIWGNFDSMYMKPLLTNSRPTLLETLPSCLTPLARILTTTEQLNQVLNLFFLQSNLILRN